MSAPMPHEPAATLPVLPRTSDAHALPCSRTQFVLLNQHSADNSEILVRQFSLAHPALDLRVFSANEPRQQNRHYARHLHRLSTDWVLIVDVDEFAYARNRVATLPHVLASIDPTVGLVAVPWKVFGARFQVLHPASVINNLTRRHNIGRNTIFPGHSVEYKCFLRLSALRTHLGLSPTASLVEGVLPIGPSSSPEINLHHAVEGLHAVLPDGTELSKYRVRLPTDARAGGRANYAGKAWNLTPQLVQRWPVHLNHYRLGSCEFWYRVRPVHTLYPCPHPCPKPRTPYPVCPVCPVPRNP